MARRDDESLDSQRGLDEHGTSEPVLSDRDLAEIARLIDEEFCHEPGENDESQVTALGELQGEGDNCHVCEDESGKVRAGYLQRLQTTLERELHTKQMTKSFFACLFLSLVLTSILEYAKSSERSLATRSALPAQRFFPVNSTVVDFYDGNVHPSELLHDAEILVLLYYAPWSAASQAIRSPLDLAARSFRAYPHVHFAAVNCWIADGRCSRAFRMYSYPVLIAYVGRLSLAFTGEHSAGAIHKWVAAILNPVRRVQSQEEMDELRTRHDYVLLAFLPFQVRVYPISPCEDDSHCRMRLQPRRDTRNSSPPRCSRLKPVLASCNCRHSLPLSISDCLVDSMVFALVIDKSLARDLREGEIRMLRYGTEQVLARWDATTVTAQGLVDAVKAIHSRDRVFHMISTEYGTGGKSEQLQTLIGNNASVILIADRDGVGALHFARVHKVASEYSDCEERRTSHDRLRSPLSQWNPEQYDDESARSARQYCEQATRERQELLACCFIVLPSSEITRRRCLQCARRDRPIRWERERTCAIRWLPYPVSRYAEREKPELPREGACQVVSRHFTPDELLDVCCAMNDGESHARLPTFSLTRREATECERARLTRSPGEAVTVRIPRDQRDRDDGWEAFAGFGCGRNRSLVFVGIDRRHAGFFMRKWAIPVKQRQAVMVIVEDWRDAIFLSNYSLTKSGIRSFIRDFHSETLSAHRMSEEDRDSRFSQPPSSPDANSNVQTIPRISASHFSHIVLDEDSRRDLLIFFSGGRWHGPSAAVLYIFHALAHYFAGFPDLIQFAIIDTSLNDLPWQYNLERLPGFVFFPAKRRSYSRVFPPDLAVSVPNLLAWTLARCQIELRWRLAATACGGRCLRRNRHRTRGYLAALRAELQLLEAMARDYPVEHVASGLIKGQIRSRRRIQRCIRQLQVLLDSASSTSTDHRRLGGRQPLLFRWLLQQLATQ